MKYARLLPLLAVACWCYLAAGGEPIVVARDGSITARLRYGQAGERATVLSFGLPPYPADKMWHEGDSLRALWVTNGIRYTETVLLAWLNGTESERSARSNRVLVVNIEGENTNSDYTDAQAKLTVKIGAEQACLELKAGLVWRQEGTTQTLLGALEIPDSGIKVASGKELQFAGNMPPSLKGSLTLKVPIGSLAGEAAAEALQSLDVDAELRRAVKSGKTRPSDPALIFASERAPGP